jgi:anti-anti-sigma factor
VVEALEVVVHLGRDRAEVRVAGELDVAVITRIEETVLDCVARGATAVDIDLRGVVFLDAGALAGLLRAVRRARGAGYTVSVSHPSLAAERLFHLAHVEEALGLGSGGGTATGGFA